MKTKYLSALLVSGVISITSLFGQNCKLVVDQDFNHRSGNELYTIAKANDDFDGVRAWTSGEIRGLSNDWPQKTRVINGELRAEYLKNDASGRAGGFLFDKQFEDTEEAVLEYKVKFDKDFVWATGGKLPGLGGSALDNNGAIPSGCTSNQNNIDNGFSCRLMWRRNRAHTQTPYLILYFYHPYKDRCGDNIRIFTGLEKEKWYTIRQYIKMNTPGQSNGIIRMWIDGEQVLNMTDALIRKSGKSNVKINSLIMNTYRGGSRTDPVWHSPTTDYAFFDDFKVWINCSNPENVSSNKAPNVSFTQPANNASYDAGQSISVDVNASDSDGSIDNVKLYLNGTFVRQENHAPYEWNHTGQNDPLLQNLSAGNYTLRAVATDDDGASNETSISFTVNAPNASPTVTFAFPQNGATLNEGDNVTVVVNASDSDGSVSNVRLFLNGTFIRQENLAPYEWNHIGYTDAVFNNMTAGSYTLRAEATDNEGKSSATTINFTVSSLTCSVIPYLNINTNGWNSTSTATVTEGDEVWFGPQSEAFGTVNSGWSWTGPNGFTATGREVKIENIQVNQGGEYTVTNTDANGCTSSLTYTITVEEVVVIGNGPILGPDCASANGTANFELAAGYRENVTNYSWWVSGSSNDLSSPAGQPYKVTSNFDQYFDGGQVCVGVNLNAAPYYTSYCKQLSECVSADAAVAGIDADVYPNPAENRQITIETSQNAGAIEQVSVQDGAGNTVYQSSSIQNGDGIDLSGLGQGSYYLRIITSNGVITKTITLL